MRSRCSEQKSSHTAPLFGRSTSAIELIAGEGSRQTPRVIVVVTGPSSAGKTTWCRQHYPDELVSEYAPTGREPDDSDPAAQADYWSEVNCQRWSQATHTESERGLAVNHERARRAALHA